MHITNDNGRTSAATPPNPSRRSLIGSAASILLTVAATAAAAGKAPPPAVSSIGGDDVELIEASAQFCDLQLQIHDLHDHLGRDERALEAALEPVYERQESLLDRMATLRATTLAGHRARAIALSQYLDPSDLDAEDGYWPDRMVAALLRDLADANGRTSAGAAVTAEDDAELLTLCAAFHRQHAAALAVGEGDNDGLDQAMIACWQISDRIKSIPITTYAGARAKASVGAVLLDENRGPYHDAGDRDAAFAYAALLDIAGDGHGVSGVAAAAKHSARDDAS